MLDIKPLLAAAPKNRLIAKKQIPPTLKTPTFKPQETMVETLSLKMQPDAFHSFQHPQQDSVPFGMPKQPPQSRGYFDRSVNSGKTKIILEPIGRGRTTHTHPSLIKEGKKKAPHESRNSPHSDNESTYEVDGEDEVDRGQPLFPPRRGDRFTAPLVNPVNKEDLEEHIFHGSVRRSQTDRPARQEDQGHQSTQSARHESGKNSGSGIPSSQPVEQRIPSDVPHSLRHKNAQLDDLKKQETSQRIDVNTCELPGNERFLPTARARLVYTLNEIKKLEKQIRTIKGVRLAENESSGADQKDTSKSGHRSDRRPKPSSGHTGESRSSQKPKIKSSATDGRRIVIPEQIFTPPKKGVNSFGYDAGASREIPRDYDKSENAQYDSDDLESDGSDNISEDGKQAIADLLEEMDQIHKEMPGTQRERNSRNTGSFSHNNQTSQQDNYNPGGSRGTASHPFKAENPSSATETKVPPERGRPLYRPESPAMAGKQGVASTVKRPIAERREYYKATLPDKLGRTYRYLIKIDVLDEKGEVVGGRYPTPEEFEATAKKSLLKAKKVTRAVNKTEDELIVERDKLKDSINVRSNSNSNVIDLTEDKAQLKILTEQIKQIGIEKETTGNKEISLCFLKRWQDIYQEWDRLGIPLETNTLKALDLLEKNGNTEALLGRSMKGIYADEEYLVIYRGFLAPYTRICQLISCDPKDRMTYTEFKNTVNAELKSSQRDERSKEEIRSLKNRLDKVNREDGVFLGRLEVWKMEANTP